MGIEILGIVTIAELMSIVALFAGITGAITGVRSLKKVDALKSLDLRLECGKPLNSVEILLENLPELIDKANQSRTNRLAAQGLSRSGVMDKWKDTHQISMSLIKKFSDQYKALKEKDNLNNPPKELKNYLLEIDLLEGKINSLIGDLNNSISEDDIARERLFKMKAEALK